MSPYYTATARQNPGRKAWFVEFRHPLRLDNSGKPGRKVRKGLATEDEHDAQELTDQLNKILQNESLWSIGAKPLADQQFRPKVVEIFYNEIEPRRVDPRSLRDQQLPPPPPDSGNINVLAIGNSGTGKTTMFRVLSGCDHDRDRFPSTSVNRTTTFPVEIIATDSDYNAVVTFITEQEARFEVEESVSAAIIKAVETDDDAAVAKVFLEQSDMRFRLKYILGDWPADISDDIDPYESEDLQSDETTLHEDELLPDTERLALESKLRIFLTQIRDIASVAKQKIVQEPLSLLSKEDRAAALDLIQEEAENSDEFTILVSDVIEDIREKIGDVEWGDFIKTTTGWPIAWKIKEPPDRRAAFLTAVRYFSGNSYKAWGKLLTPIVNGIRVKGPFFPTWTDEHLPLVLIDTEGLSHKADAMADVPDHIVSLFGEVDVIILVDNAESAMTSYATAKALEAVASAGFTEKLVVAFTHFDKVSGKNFRGIQAKKDHTFNGIRNVVENHIANSLTSDVARHLLRHLETNTYYLGALNRNNLDPAKPELNALLKRLRQTIRAPLPQMSFPEYSLDNLVLAILEATEAFRRPWRARLGLESHPEIRPAHWASIKALTRRYAEDFDDGYWLRPKSNLRAALANAISKFLDKPLRWQGDPNEEEKRQIIDAIKAKTSKRLSILSDRRLQKMPQPEWQKAYAYRGTGSGFLRKMDVEGIYERWVPIPRLDGDMIVQEMIDAVKEVVGQAIEDVQKDISNERLSNVQVA